LGARVVEEVLLDVAGEGAEAASGVGRELRGSAFAAVSHGEENAVDPCVDRHRVEWVVGEEGDAVGDFHADAG